MSQETHRIISKADVGGHIDWLSYVDALELGHKQPRAEVQDVFLGPSGSSLLSRSAFIKGLGFGVKSVTVFAENPARGLPSIQGAMLMFDPLTGTLSATIDSALVTDLKTAADSVLGARFLARKDSEHLVVVGAGAVAKNMIDAYTQVFPAIKKVSIWNRTYSKAQALAALWAEDSLNVSAVEDLKSAVQQADIVTSATMSEVPIILGDWVAPGTHVDLIGAFRAEMREADDALLQKARLFVDSRDTTLHHIGELMIPLASGAITESHVLADFYDLAAGCPGRLDHQDITVFKNGGGAHLDLMTAHAILNTI